ncbi:hypothetical protein [Chryseobacterium fistulae]|uniref:Bacteriocin n=1 Tax=Chryseobacterium fistulae TaxID=2675058 RepID=A0A6N4XSP2_9FLAO|nr:hypothetical protein [Chryseobacterium fistulae]CAA7392474.1 hypothetical protein CHRY9393_03194 [Chryseobacterium fistulae]
MKNLKFKMLTSNELIEINGGESGDNFWYDVGYAVGTSVIVNGNAMLYAAVHIKKMLK